MLDSRFLPTTEVGDLLVYGRAEAYCESMSITHYNSNTESPIVLVRKNELEVIRYKEPLLNLWRREEIPSDLIAK